MKKDFNEIVNKYIDNELNENELNEVEKMIESDEDFKTSITVQKFVHDSLHEIPLKSAPIGFTDLVMNKIIKKLSEKYKKNYLFRGVVSILSLVLVFILFIFFYYLGELEVIRDAAATTDNIFDKIVPTVTYLSQIVKTDLFKTITGLIGFIVLIGFYFNLNSHKELKEKLKQL
jgi:hypothetical protein